MLRRAPRGVINLSKTLLPPIGNGLGCGCCYDCPVDVEIKLCGQLSGAGGAGRAGARVARVGRLPGTRENDNESGAFGLRGPKM